MSLAVHDGLGARGAMLRRGLGVIVAALWLLLLVACEQDATVEARMFLDRLDGLDFDDPVPERRRRVNNLASMPLNDPGIREARDVCVEAHRSLLEAEDLHASASASLARYEDESRIPIPERQRIQRDITGSNAALGRARDLVSRCERHTRDLDRRYRRQRR